MKASSKTQFNVKSEVGLLEKVVIHTPGPEMSLVSPDNFEMLLFDDILFEETAREEHLTMCKIFEKVIGDPAGVLEIRTLIGEAFQKEEARADFIEGLFKVSPERNFQAFEKELKSLSASELEEFAITGNADFPINALPVPNLMFTRDLCAVIGNHALLSKAATDARSRESLLVQNVFHHHPEFAHLKDNLIELPEAVSFEGGDLLVATDKIVLIGHSERTSFGGIMAITKALLSRTDVEHVLMVDIPKTRSSMHLDTVFTFSDEYECMVFPPLFQPNQFNVVHFQAGATPDTFQTELLPDLKHGLELLMDHPITYIPCGGSNPILQKREQWTDGANLFAVAPGLVLAYERNQQTFNTLRDNGYRVVTAEGFLDYYSESKYVPGEKLAIKLAGTELSRGRGGARCMTMPLSRRPLV